MPTTFAMHRVCTLVPAGRYLKKHAPTVSRPTRTEINFSVNLFKYSYTFCSHEARPWQASLPRTEGDVDALKRFSPEFWRYLTSFRYNGVRLDLPRGAQSTKEQQVWKNSNVTSLFTKHVPVTQDNPRTLLWACFFFFFSLREVLYYFYQTTPAGRITV